MRAAVSFLLIVLLLSVAAFSPVPAGPRSGTISTREPSGSWSDVQRVAAGTELIVIVRGSPAVHRLFLSVDAAALFVLDLTPLALSRETERRVRDIVTAHVTELIGGAQAEFVNADLRVGPEAVFIVNRKLAELPQVIQRIDRADVLELRLAASRRPSSVLKATATGAAIGAGLGLGFDAIVLRCRAACAESWTSVLVLLGAGVGAAVGASIATARIGRPDHEARVIYSVP